MSSSKLDHLFLHNLSQFGVICFLSNFLSTPFCNHLSIPSLSISFGLELHQFRFLLLFPHKISTTANENTNTQTVRILQLFTTDTADEMQYNTTTDHSVLTPTVTAQWHLQQSIFNTWIWLPRNQCCKTEIMPPISCKCPFGWQLVEKVQRNAQLLESTIPPLIPIKRDTPTMFEAGLLIESISEMLCHMKNWNYTGQGESVP